MIKFQGIAINLQAEIGMHVVFAGGGGTIFMKSIFSD